MGKIVTTLVILFLAANLLGAAYCVFIAKYSAAVGGLLIGIGPAYLWLTLKDRRRENS